MFLKNYPNFVKPSSHLPQSTCRDRRLSNIKLDGDQVQQLYLEEVQDVNVNDSPSEYPDIQKQNHSKKTHRKRKLDIDTSDKNLLRSVQHNDVHTLKDVLNICPEKINTVDEFGWSLLMIACQANSVEAVKELLKRGVDTSIRDKAGNSARTLVIKNKNFILADIFLNTKNSASHKTHTTPPKPRFKEEYKCETCNKVFSDKQEHLSSTIHNINASTGKKLPPNFIIPESNRGYQIMLKVGWDKESGLGRHGSGNKYPVKAVQKLDKNGLGHERKNKEEAKDKECERRITKQILHRDYHDNRRFEINFRREFY